MNEQFSIKVYKQYFNFAASHFLIFKDGTREPLHGHNYRVKIKGGAAELKDDLVFDFLHIKPIVKEICNSLDHRLLLPEKNNALKIQDEKQNYKVTINQDYFSFPKQDIRLLPIENTSAERLAIYMGHEITKKVFEQYNYRFENFEIEVEETPGQSAIYIIKD